jgi:hypothetical protein
MKQSKWVLLSQFFLALVFAAFAVGQSTPATNPSSEPAPKLSHFDPALADPSLAPCDDFYKFACSKWISANPIPPDQLSWGTGSGLGYWNDNILRETMQKAAAKSGSRADYEQKIGDYWTACMKEDDQGNAASSSHELKSDLDRISRMKEKKQLAETVAYLHKSIPAAWSGDDNQTAAALFGFGQIQDLDDSTKVVAFIDQGGLALPNRDFYLKVCRYSQEVPGSHQQDASARRRQRICRRSRGERSPRHRNGAGASPDGQRLPPRPQEPQQQDEPYGIRGAQSILCLAALSGTSGRSRIETALPR